MSFQQTTLRETRCTSHFHIPLSSNSARHLEKAVKKVTKFLASGFSDFKVATYVTNTHSQFTMKTENTTAHYNFLITRKKYLGDKICGKSKIILMSG